MWVSCQNGEPGCQAVDGDGMREFYSLAGLLASALAVLVLLGLGGWTAY